MHGNLELEPTWFDEEMEFPEQGEQENVAGTMIFFMPTFKFIE